jgi:hypothetical protein
MAVTQLEIALVDYEQAKRHVRRLNDQAKHEHALWRLKDRSDALERLERARTRLEQVEAIATRPHECRESTACRCSMVADAPKEECPAHGWGSSRPKCAECGRFIATRPDGAETRHANETETQANRT